MNEPHLCHNPACRATLTPKAGERPHRFALRKYCDRSCAGRMGGVTNAARNASDFRRKTPRPVVIAEPAAVVKPSAPRADATAEEAFLHDYEVQHAIHSWQRADAFSERLEALQKAFPEQSDRTLRSILCRYDLRSNGDDILREAVRWEKPRKAVFSGSSGKNTIGKGIGKR